MKTLHIGEAVEGGKFALPLELVTQTVAILAKRGVGKTYTANVMAEEMLKAGQQICVLDPTGAWYGLRSLADGSAGPWPVYIFGGEHGDVPLEENSGEVIARAIVEQGISAVLDFSLMRKGQTIRFAGAFLETLYRLNRNPLHVFVDEADAFAPQKCMHDEARLLGAMEDLVRRGRKRGLGVTLITQRPAVLNKNVLTQCEVLVALRLIHPKDIAAIMEWVEVHASDEQAKTMVDSLPSLPVGTAWFWSPGWGDFFARVKVRERLTFDSGSTPKVGQVQAKPKALATVDIAKLNAEIQQTIQRTKDNDPAALRAIIRKLESEKLKAERVNAKAQSEDGRREGKDKAAAQVERLVALKMADQYRFFERQQINIQRNLLRVLSDVVRQVFLDAPNIKDHKAAFNAKAHPVADVVGIRDFQRVEKALHAQPAKIYGGARAGSMVDGSGRAVPLAQRHGGQNAEPRNSCVVGNGGLRRMMIALAQRPGGLTKRQLGVRAGLSSRSGTFGTYLARGRSEGWLGGGEVLEITPDGIEALGTYQELPTGLDLLNYWLGELGNCGAARMLRHIAMSYPRALSREEVGAAAEIIHTSGTFGTYLAKLRSLELVETTADGLRLAEELAG